MNKTERGVFKVTTIDRAHAGTRACWEESVTSCCCCCFRVRIDDGGLSVPMFIVYDIQYIVHYFVPVYVFGTASR